MNTNESAFKKFKETMVHLEQRRSEIVTRIFKKIDGERLQILRKKIESRKQP